MIPFLTSTHASRRLLTTVCLSATAGLLLAQTPIDDEGKPFELSTLEVTATHFPEIAAEVPVSVEILDAADVASFATTTLPEALSRQAGVQVRSLSGSPTQATIDLRGMGVTAGQRVLVLVNGRRLNRPDLGQINWFQVAPGDIERVEILKGGQSVIYGDHAVGGVIKLQLAEPTDAGGGLTLTAGTDGLRSGHLGVDTPAAGGGLRFSLSGLSSEGYRERSGVEAFNASAAAVFRWDPAWSSETFVQVASNEAELAGALFSIGFPEDPKAPQYLEDYSDEQSWAIDQILRGTFGQEVEMELSLGASQRANEFLLFSGGFFPSIGETELTSLALRPRFRAQVAAIDWVFGFDLEQDQLEYTGFGDETRADATLRADLERLAYGVYFHGETALSETLSLRFGARQQWVETEVETTFSGARTRPATAATFGLNFRPSPRVRLWARYDRVFRFPVADEYASYQGFPLDPPFNAALKPEKGHNLEVGTQWTNGTWFFAASAFYLAMDDEIAFDNSVFLNTNLPATRRLGVDWAGRYRSERFSAGVAWTAIEAAYAEGPNDGARPSLVPENQITVDLNLPLGPAWSLGASARHVSRQYEDGYLDRAAFAPDGVNPDPWIPAHTIVDAYLQFRQAAWSLQLAGTNLTDEAYADYKVFGSWYPAPGIGARAQVKYRW